MAETVATALVYLVYVYLGLGTAFALLFVSLGAQQIDRQAADSGIAFRLLILPGSAALWPLLLTRWLKATGEAPVVRNPHR
ncbi:MAG TPA: hypothetical protein VN830_04640 [Verrucomicrobiae bacterium]|nr:hypothetical protein [Verrucomicrobiae bacterium]